MNNKKKIILGSILGIFIGLIISTTYAIFSYTRTGENQELITGDIYMHYNETNGLTLENAMPSSTYDPAKYFEFTIKGKNTNTKYDIWYDIILNRGSVPTGKTESNRIDDRFIKFRLVEVINNEESELFTNKAYGELVNGKRVHVATIPKNTLNEVTKTYRLYMWIASNVIIGNEENPYKDYDLTTWNNLFASVKVSSTGDFEEKTVSRTLNEIIEEDAVMDNIQSEFVTSQTGIDFSQISSDTNGKGVYIRSGTENDAYPIMYYRGAVENNNVLFANKCWKMVRTTDTGGVKLIYNGENKGTSEAPNCDNTGTDTQITLNIDGTDKNKFSFSGTGLNNSPAYNGYMYGTVYNVTNGEVTDANNTYFGTGFTYDTTNNQYTLTNAKKGIDENHHYTCNETSAFGTCANIRYYFTYYTNYYLYFTLNSGKSIEDAIREMQTNTNDFNAKDKIDTWYAANIENNVSYAQMLEDTIFCNDRRISTLGGLNPNGGVLTSNASSYYAGYARAYQTYNPSLSCQKNDAFTLPNGRGNGALANPVGLITSDEIMLAGGKAGTANGTFYLKSGANYWSSAPSNFNSYGNAREFLVSSNGNFGDSGAHGALGLRPAISLTVGTGITGGDGTVSNPYVVE